MACTRPTTLRFRDRFHGSVHPARDSSGAGVGGCSWGRRIRPSAREFCPYTRTPGGTRGQSISWSADVHPRRGAPPSPSRNLGRAGRRRAPPGHAAVPGRSPCGDGASPRWRDHSVSAREYPRDGCIPNPCGRGSPSAYCRNPGAAEGVHAVARGARFSRRISARLRTGSIQPPPWDVNQPRDRQPRDGCAQFPWRRAHPSIPRGRSPPAGDAGIRASPAPDRVDAP